MIYHLIIEIIYNTGVVNTKSAFEYKIGFYKKNYIIIYIRFNII